MPNEDRLAVTITPVVSFDRLDRVTDGVAEIQHGAHTGLLTFILRDDLGLQLATAGDDGSQALGITGENRLDGSFEHRRKTLRRESRRT